jgi:CheY-like chemotaxis protein/HPt (histidine-containing phosphotransfer) domain-containing protein
MDLVMVDRLLPDGPGKRLLEKIRASAHLHGIAVVVLNSAMQLGEAEMLKKCGADAVLLKPYRQRQLCQTLSRVLSEEPAPLPVRGGGSRPPVPVPTRTRGLRVLIVEDNFINQKVAQRHVEKLGHTAEVANHGAEALDMLALQRYDLIFMDCQMPVLDGYETTRRIRAGRVPNLDPAVPIIALTAYATEMDRQKCFAAGMDDFVAKPIRYEDLQASLDRRLSREKESVPVAGSNGSADTAQVVLDRSQFDHLCDLQDAEDPDFIRDLVDLFLVETPRRIGDMRAALKKGDVRTLAHIAHTVKGAAANFGARAVQTRCHQIEALARAGKLADIEPVLSGLESENVRLAQALEKQKQRVAVENSRR